LSGPPEVPARSHGVDWQDAEAFYLGLDRSVRTYAEVARRFEISDVRVGQIARSRRWQEKALEIDRRLEESSIRLVVRSREQRIKKTLGIVDRLLDRYESGVDGLELKPSDLPNLVKLAELLVGEPTDRVEVATVRRVFAILIERAGRFVTLEQRPAFLLEMRELESALPEPERPALDTGPEIVQESPA
jgi:hypothetical protein